jgi:C4-dicarboxylate-specific signal transduction histidine kinase
VNNPLTIVYGQACRLRMLVNENSVTREELLLIAERMEDMSFRIVSIINGLRAFTRDGANDPMEFTSFKKLIENTLIFCRGKIATQGIELEIDPIDNQIEAFCRPVQISQVLLNLLNNACDAVAESDKKWIKIRVNLTENYLEMRIIDSGPGIAPENRSHLFQAFFTTKIMGKGTGLGLSVAKTIMSSHKGEILLEESAPHTTFLVRLPRVTSN